jgi:uncharacterized protein
MDIFQIVICNETEDFYSCIDLIDINIKNEDDANLLHKAIAYNHTDIGIELIRRGINVNCQDSEGLTPLHCTAWYKNYEIAKLILDNGGNINIKDIHGNAPLWAAVFNAKGDYRVVELLLKYGANPHHKNKYGKSPLDFAQQIKDQQLITLLTEGTI